MSFNNLPDELKLQIFNNVDLTNKSASKKKKKGKDLVKTTTSQYRSRNRPGYDLKFCAKLGLTYLPSIGSSFFWKPDIQPPRTEYATTMHINRFFRAETLKLFELQGNHFTPWFELTPFTASLGIENYLFTNNNSNKGYYLILDLRLWKFRFSSAFMLRVIDGLSAEVKAQLRWLFIHLPQDGYTPSGLRKLFMFNDPDAEDHFHLDIKALLPNLFNSNILVPLLPQ
ncbi:hypothetical protein P280DRAFT_518810 [Massarina eburnea CBS 473.64]|uniref:Uncharacterized protein n=1 Tax=Massarina eburnea CBS 473.64 TaxID=1395130 RepID=A0A6A6RXW2_9PLEO|nr:hypothetical protein P280DRAFT_518810 [Massarina eburnea CBS 473.64]